MGELITSSKGMAICVRLIYALTLLLLTLILGSLYLSWDARSFPKQIDEPCDNIVILTGGRYRIRHIFNTVRDSENFKPKNIFISGVHSKTSLKDIFVANMDLKNDQWLEKIKQCNFILGKNAHNTIENAEEIDEWVRDNSIKKVVLVTSDYHMRRSMMILKYKNRDLEVIPCAVRSFHKRSLTYLEESLKIIYTWIKLLLRS